MSTAILHIGTHKTGTTSLQSFFQANAAEFERQGICVPLFDIYPMMGKTVPNQNRNGYFLMLESKFAVYPENRTPENTKHIEKDIEKFAKLAASHENILLTDEAFWLEGAWDIAFWHRCKEVLDSCGIDQVKLVVYLRRQDELASSLWRHYIKGTSEWGTLNSFIKRDRISRALDYRTAASAIESVFGEGCLKVRVFDRSSFTGGDIYHDFCDAIGLDWQDDFKIPEDDLNPSLTTTATEIKRWANANARYRDSSNFLRVPVMHVSERKDGQPRTSTLTSKAYESLRAECEEGNIEIAEKYLGGRGGRLVEWPPYDTQYWDSHETEVLQSIVQVFAEAMAVQESRIVHQAQEIKNLKAQVRKLSALEARLTELETIEHSTVKAKVMRRLKKS